MVCLKPIRTVLSTAILAIVSENLCAAGFSLYTEGNGSAVGNFAAGIAAEAADASTGWYNPAGLALLHKQEAVLGGVGVFPSITLKNGVANFAATAGTPYTQTFNSLQSKESALVPSFHYARPLNDKATIGLSVLAPFGLSTNWGETSPVRYFATKSDLKTYNVAPEIGLKVHEHAALGFGLDMQYADVTFNSVFGLPMLSTPPTGFDSSIHNQGHSFGVGFHAGILTFFNENHTRVGLNYQSMMHHEFSGISTAYPTAVDPTDPVWSSNLSSGPINLPQVITLSGYQDINSKLALLGSVVYTGWHSMQEIELDNVAVFATRSTTNVESPLGYRNTWRLAVGANYHWSENLMFRVGGGYDQTPTVDAYRDPRLPEMNRWAVSIGSHYQIKPDLGLDVGYTYLFPDGQATLDKTEVLNSPAGTLTKSLQATADANASLFGAQLVWKFDYGMNHA